MADRTTHYEKFTDNNRPLATNLDNFFQHMTSNIVHTTVGNTPPWHIPPDIDKTLASQVKKKDAPHILTALACEKINQQYADHVHIYTDASKDSSGKVGIGCHIRLSTTSHSIDKVARLTDGVAVQTLELAAIRIALQNIHLLENTTSYRRYAIFTYRLTKHRTELFHKCIS